MVSAVYVPWASVTDPKTGKRKAKIKPIATGLWSRYGNPILAPDAFLNLLPCCPLDGELWAGRGNFQLCRSICGGDTADPRFMDKIDYAVYSCPAWGSVFATGEITNANMVCSIDHDAVQAWARDRVTKWGVVDYQDLWTGAAFSDELAFLNRFLDNGPGSKCFLHAQMKLSDITGQADEQVEAFLQKVLDQGGEGVVMRKSDAIWTPKRHKGILKYKPFEDAEATVTGFTSGRETDKGSRLLGKIGALITDFNGKRLELSGMKDFEREFKSESMSAYAATHPGADMPSGYEGKCFKVGQMVTLKYRELTDDGIPKEARYWRRRDVE